jgi:hypothetical protein
MVEGLAIGLNPPLLVFQGGILLLTLGADPTVTYQFHAVTP